jgi:hypothetical protein
VHLYLLATQASKLEVELAEQQQQLEEASCCLQRTQLQHQAQLADLQREHEQRYMAMLRQQQQQQPAASVEQHQQSGAAALQQALHQGSVAAAAAALLGRQLGGGSSSSSQQEAQYRPSYAGIAATVAAVFGGPGAAAATAATLQENCSSSRSAAPADVVQAAAAAAAAAGVAGSPKRRPAGPQLSELMACLAEQSGSHPQLSQLPDDAVQQQRDKKQQDDTAQRELPQPAAAVAQSLASPEPAPAAQDDHRTTQKARQSSQGYQTGVAFSSNSSDVALKCQSDGRVAAEDSEASPSKLQAKLAAYRSYLKHASPTKSSAAAAAAPSSSSEGGCGMQVKTQMQHPGSFHSQSDGGVHLQRSSEEQQQHWPAVTSMSDGGVVLHTPAGPATAEALATVSADTALHVEDATAEEAAESHLDEASSTRTSDDSWGTASDACSIHSRAETLQHRRLSSSISVTPSLINMKRQSLQGSGQLKGLASYARFAATEQKQEELQGQQPQLEASAFGARAAHSVDLSVHTRQPGASQAVRTGRISSCKSSSSRRGSQLSSSCSALFGLDKRQVRAEIAAAGGMAAIVEQFSSSLFEDAGGDTGPGSAAAAVESWAGKPTASVVLVEASASGSVDVSPLESGASRATRTKKQIAVHHSTSCVLSASRASVLVGDNSQQVYDQVELVQQQQQVQQKMLRRSQAATSNSNRMGW